MKSVRPLEDWLGQRVRVRGDLKTWKPLERGDTAYLLSDVEIQLYNGGEIRYTDHIWQIYPSDIKPMGNVTRLTRMLAVGEVIRYTRMNKTSDYSVKVAGCIDVFSDPPQCPNAMMRMEYLQTCLEYVTEQTALVPIGFDLEAWRKAAEVEIDSLKRHVDTNINYTIQSAFNSRGKPNPDILPFGKRKRRRQVKLAQPNPIILDLGYPSKRITIASPSCYVQPDNASE